MDADHSGVCPACGGPSMPMGVLGSRMHFRCRNCGIDSSKKMDHHDRDFWDLDNESYHVSDEARDLFDRTGWNVK